MNIVIISEFCGDLSITDNDRFLYLAQMLVNDLGENPVEFVTSSFRHSMKTQRRKAAHEWPFKVTFIDEPGYTKNVCLRRFYSHYIWGKNVIRYIRSLAKKPDVVYCAVPSLTGPNLVARYCERENIRFIVDIQDLWPEAFKMVLNIPVISDMVFFPFKIIADGIYKRADMICAVSKTYEERALKVNKKNYYAIVVYLGTEIASFDKYSNENVYNFKGDNQIVLAYAGTLGTSYDLTMVFEAMRKLNNQRLKFIIVGDGPLKAKFEKDATDLNVVFMGRLPYEKTCGVLKAADIVINPIVKSSVASIINKHADYAASGKPVINTQTSREYRELVNNYEMGYNCDSAEEIVEALNTMILNEPLRARMGKNARICAEEVFDRAKTYKRISDMLKKRHNEVKKCR